ncbi:MAG: hypothetical protein H0V97_05920 [Actinobacteria bacterium]|nr:hypothetical protein [Actinomycetota bacterium]
MLPEAGTSKAIEWLLASEEPAVRYLASRDLLDDDAAADRSHITEGGNFRALLAGQQPDGGFGVHPYKKWTGAHWRLVSLVELGAPRGESRAIAAADTVLSWLTSAQRRSKIRVVEGRVAPLRVSRGERTCRLLPARARGRPARQAARRIADRMAMARWWLEL